VKRVSVEEKIEKVRKTFKGGGFLKGVKILVLVEGRKAVEEVIER